MIKENKEGAPLPDEEKPETAASAKSAAESDASADEDSLADLDLGEISEMVGVETDTDDEEDAEENEGDGAAGEEKPADEEEEEGETTEDDEDDSEKDDESNEDEGEIKGLSKELNAKIERRIKKMDAKRKAAEEQLQGRIQELESELSERSNAGSKESAPTTHELMLADEATIRKADKALRDQMESLEDHWDGYEPEKEGEQAFTAKEIHARHRELKRMRENLIPEALANAQKRNEVDTTLVAKLFPDLMKPGSVLQKKAQKMAESIPGLRSNPYANLFLGMALIGEQVIGERIKKAKQANSKAPIPQKKTSSPPTPTPSRTGRTEAGKKIPAAGNRLQKFIEGGSTTEALAAILD